jgi:hypothetical protein
MTMKHIEWYEVKHLFNTYQGILGSVKVAEVKKSLFSSGYRLKFFLTEDAIPFEETFNSLNECWQTSERLLEMWIINSCLPVEKHP